MPDQQELLKHLQSYLEAQRDFFGEEILLPRPGSHSANSPPAEAKNSEEPWMQTANLPDLDSQINTCMKCSLGAARTNFVFGSGNLRAKIMFIGEAPGAEEDAQGIPFVGRAGKLLDKIIEAMGMKREDVYICNILKCRPPGNRDPEPTEMESCTPYLYKQIELIKPRIIVCLGRISAQWLLKTSETLGALRGKVHDFMGARLLVTYHPAALLRNEQWKRPTWDDMKKVLELLKESEIAAV
jgi:DNA polymerase